MAHQMITDMELREIAERVKNVQRMAGFTNLQMAELWDISEVQYEKLLRGVCMVTEDKFLILHKEFGISLDYLFTGRERGEKSFFITERKTTDLEFRIYLNEIAVYVKELENDSEKTEKMMEMVMWFYKLFGTAYTEGF